MKVIVIGGVAAGMSAASKLRRTDKTAQIIVYEQGQHLSYGACGLPYYVADEIKDYRSLIMRTKADFEKIGITVHTGHRVTAVDTNEKTVEVLELETGNLKTDRYDRLLIATGASAHQPDWPGKDLERVKTLGTIEDGQAIKALAMDEDVKKVTIIGAGFIGLEMAETMRTLNKQVVLIMPRDQVMTKFDKEVVEPLEKEMRDHEVDLHTNENVLSLEGDTRVRQVVTDQGRYDTDLVIVSVGIRPNTRFLSGTSVRMLSNGAVIVDGHMRTNVPDVFAAGDCASVVHKILGTDAYIPLGTNANRQGKVAGSVMAGEEASYDQALGTMMIRVFDLEAAKTGLTEKEAIKAGIPYRTVSVKTHNHASYYPDSKPVYVKLVYRSDDYVLLGAQLVGHAGTALRVNICAVAIHARMTVHELGMVDLGYTPPFSPVWDPVAVACNAAK